MARRTDIRSLPAPAAGTAQQLLIHRFGPESVIPESPTGRKAYIQASLHADETPGLLVAHHLLRLLQQAETNGEVTGQIALVPYANPLGLAQFFDHTQLGRFEFALSGGNFNRNWPDLAALAGDRVAGQLSDDAGSNVTVIRTAFRNALDEITPQRSLQALRLILAREACDADLVLDLHCDDLALPHLFLIPQHWPQAQDLAAELGVRAVLLAEDSGGGSFDEAFSTPWLRLAERFSGAPIPPACEAATVELRGWMDVNDAQASADALAIFRTLQRRGFIAGQPGALPKLHCEATELTATDSVKAPSAGVVVYGVEPGDRVKIGDLICEIVDPAATDPKRARRAITATTDGLILSIRSHRYVTPGMALAKIVGRTPLPHRSGYLLED
ncbi:succinylglutamate desuccinylase/aspartoacylase family protein [Algihabitans albus]|uniref:succinylglutamate desuccinylase/aspartoacylase family protein n=1 Tax=Algihabitans albus TaxID=2164067 RepID=UPI000E5C906A|nr:succinylglutamate desuccinylase/aspartoacylase family protein [Algihabitans albus]